MKLVIVESRFAPARPAPKGLECCHKLCTQTCCKPASTSELCVGHDCEYCDAWRSWLEELEHNIDYARAAMRDCLLRGEAPYASHLLYTQPGVLDDTVPADRELGIQAGFEWRRAAELTVVYEDLGMSKGMEAGVKDAEARGVKVEYRSLPGWRTSGN